ncbi:MAG: L-2-hydroxyglutarate oxidase [Chloroflexi bacterium]|nr:L-2-hydroxyglutarate oxidase [Chloroflexota bacterium]
MAFPHLSSHNYDIVIVGAGILGMATALELSYRYSRYKIGVVEKEKRLGAHQTGHNSGVIHSGIYYRPGSLKAKTCVAGARGLIEFCQENDVRYELCGKVILAANEREESTLEELYRRGVANGVPGLEKIGVERLRELEPYAHGSMALYSPNTGIVDYGEVTNAYANKFRQNGGDVLTETKLLGIRQVNGYMHLITNLTDLSTRYLINCAGLYADMIARMMGVGYDVRIIPFRGDYYMLSPEASHLVKGLIYPVPDQAFPFLGVHFTRTIHGHVEAGPNAVLAFAREGYKMSKINLTETMATISYRGFWAMAARYWRTGMAEFYRSLSKRAFTRALQNLLPDIKEENLQRGNAGVRAQAVDRKGFLLDDFRISETKNAIHVLNAPSPGATASLAISRDIVAMAEKSFALAG